MRINGNSTILWEGPSRITGKDIVVILSGIQKSSNIKTSEMDDRGMLQTYIMDKRMDPVEIVNKGLDESICGNCPARGTKKSKREKKNGRQYKERWCYVNTGFAPRAIWHSWNNGNIRHFSELSDRQTKRLEGRALRFGSYGDPAAVPPVVWWEVNGVVRPKKKAGYTHQWMNNWAMPIRPFAMASVESPEQRQQAKDRGFRTFRVRLPGSPLLKGEIDCPAPRGVTCDKCGACDGATPNDGRVDVSIEAHGNAAKVGHAKRYVNSLPQVDSLVQIKL